MIAWSNAKVSDGGGWETRESAKRCRPPPFAPPKSCAASCCASSQESLDILWRLQLLAAERAEDHGLLMKLPLLAAASLV